MVYPGHAHEMSLSKEYWDRASDPHGMQWPWLEQDPYKTIYAQLHQAAKCAKVIVVIGYAFHDKLVNQEILKASRHAKILVVDPGIERYNKATDATHIDPPFEWLKLSEHGTPWSRFYFLDEKFGPEDTTQAIIDGMKRLPHLRSPRRKKLPSPLALLSPEEIVTEDLGASAQPRLPSFGRVSVRRGSIGSMKRPFTFAGITATLADRRTLEWHRGQREAVMATDDEELSPPTAP
jgi:hypothetical protein